MYTLNNEDIWLVGQMHEKLEHDCHLSAESGCEFHEKLVEAYAGAKDEQVKRKLAQLQS